MFGAVRSQRRAPGSALLASAFRLGLRAPSSGCQASSYSASPPGRVPGREPPPAECWGGDPHSLLNGQLTVNSQSTHGQLNGQHDQVLDAIQVGVSSHVRAGIKIFI